MKLLALEVSVMLFPPVPGVAAVATIWLVVPPLLPLPWTTVTKGLEQALIAVAKLAAAVVVVVLFMKVPVKFPEEVEHEELAL